MSESDIQHQIRLRLGGTGDVILFRNNGGVDRSEGRFIRYGLLGGSSDLIGILKPTGRFIALEVKKPGGRVSQKQKLFMDLVRSFGGFAAIVYSVADAVAAVSRASCGGFE